MLRPSFAFQFFFYSKKKEQKVEKALLTQIQDNQKLIKELELYKKKFGNISVEGQEEGEEKKKEP